jgi:acyl dehydratase
VDVYAYLTHLPVERWGIDVLSRGAISARFTTPVYDGDVITVDAIEDGDGLLLTLFDSRGDTCATASATLPSEAPTAPPPDEIPAGPLPSDVPRASPELFAPRPHLGSYEFGFHAEHAPSYLRDIRETLPVYTEQRISHPGWLLRSANYVLTANARVGPWIHVSSDVQFHDLVHDGDEVSTRARVIDDFEKKGHKFVVLDVLYVANSSRVVMRVKHTAIYEPRHND